MAKRSWKTVLEIQAALNETKEDNKILTYDLEDMLSLLEESLKSIEKSLNPADLHLNILYFNSIRTKCHSEILSRVSTSYTASQQSNIQRIIEKYKEIAIDSPSSWPETFKTIYNFVRNNEQDINRTCFIKNDLSYKISNLKEFSLSLSSEPEEPQEIEAMDPLDYLRTAPKIFEDLKQLSDDLVFSQVLDLLETIVSEAIEEYKNTKPPVTANPPGLCGGECRIH